MQLEATYNHGRLEFKQPVRFIHEHFSVLVTIPEGEIVKLTEAKPAQFVNAAPASRAAVILLDRIKHILGNYYYPRPPATVAQDKASYLEALEEKYLS